MALRVLLVQDDEALRAAIAIDLREAGFGVSVAGTVQAAIQMLDRERVDLLLVDVRLPDGTGLEVLRHCNQVVPAPRAIVMTGQPQVETAVEAMKEGAHDYVTKPVSPDDLIRSVQHAAESLRLARRVDHLERDADRWRVPGIQGESQAIAALRDQVFRVAATHVPVLILGETGVGKELVAESIHRLSPRRDVPLVRVNCSAISEHLLESELFGHERGAFTDAKQAKPGLFEMADGGTLFLDEIGEMRPHLQAELLRIVEGQPFRRVGGRREIVTDTRIVAATNRDLADEVGRGGFREDLYFRLNVFPIAVPPLRERGDDVLLLARHFLDETANKLHRAPARLSVEAEKALNGYQWPGNVRELRNVIERASILADDGVISPRHLPAELHADSFVRRHAPEPETGLPTLEQVEQRFIEYALEQTEGNISEAARQLGIARNTLKKRLS